MSKTDRSAQGSSYLRILLRSTLTFVGGKFKTIACFTIDRFRVGYT